MPPRTTPTARQLRIGAELRRLREAAGVVSRDAAGSLGTSQAQISNIEAGKNGISEARLRRLTRIYACDDTQLVDALAEMANTQGQGWWEEYRGIVPPAALDVAELEHHASYVCTFQVVHIPGVLQTEEHVRAASIFVEPDLPEKDREARVTFRIRRQQVLGAGTPYDVIIHEAALRMLVGGGKVARTQLEHILQATERDSVSIRVIPFTVDGFAGAGHAMQYVGGPVPQLDTVQLDSTHGAVFIDAPAQLHRYRARWERVASAAAEQDASLDLIRRITQEL
ncbi:transcriptional regulator with XRE-family HTH domain [Streptomyces aurantiacus]|uniref:helix-turn-helix domain-containing protein n=1 Tax=Streptomyces aurantiacus TaxID=47760 RepID=UPI00278EE694|nr:helix-turn-helix transcriptional regulator [Streptomyces aurantiacus]MDQ0776024.1 transcriptional regulator with XRE-family HTH domain [Streptomyces aurantiacus]